MTINPLYPELSLIPQPNKLTVSDGEIRLLPTSRIFATEEEVKSEAEFLAQQLRRATGFPFEIIDGLDTAKDDNDIALALAPDVSGLGSEGYRITTDEGQPLTISAGTTCGIGRGIQTLLQLLPAAIFDCGPRNKGFVWVMPRVMIEDSPRFQWRGAMLDCVRHFMPVEFVKKFINVMALHKLNTFHWHLTDDQGWRLEIKKYPKLTSVGSRRRETMLGHYDAKHYQSGASGDGIPHEGFYTQEEAREIVAYAAARHITVVPEIEMPGHNDAAIAAYPELGCTGEEIQVRTEWGISPHILNPKQSTIEFFKDILREVLAIFPSEFIHIGGDEALKCEWDGSPEVIARMSEVGAKDSHELQSWFIRCMDRFLTEQGRRLVGWDEILEGGLAPGAAVMSWRGVEGGIAAAKQGHDAVISSYGHTYLDYYQAADQTGEPLAICGCLTLEMVYGFEPIPDELTPDEAKHIIGVQGQVWTEYMQTPTKVEYMAFPRLAALAEVAWSSASSRNYSSFRAHLSRHLQRLNILGVSYRPLD